MAMMAGSLYDALVSAGTPPEKARAAAEEIAIVNKEQVDLRGEFKDIRGELNVVKWMLGTMIALQLGTVGTIVAFAMNHIGLR